MTNANVNAFLDSTNEYESVGHFSELLDQGVFTLITGELEVVKDISVFSNTVLRIK